MKLKLYLLSLLVACLCLQSCDDDDDKVIQLPATVADAFAQRYPGAVVTEWEAEYGLYKADFWNNGAQAEAYFQPDGTWVRTETDVAYNSLPQPVRDKAQALRPGAYPEDCELVDTPLYHYYQLEYDVDNGPDFYLYLTADGTEVSSTGAPL